MWFLNEAIKVDRHLPPTSVPLFERKQKANSLSPSPSGNNSFPCLLSLTCHFPPSGPPLNLPFNLSYNISPCRFSIHTIKSFSKKHFSPSRK